MSLANQNDLHIKKVVLGGGCFWCIEAVFQKIEGVHNVISGYTGGVSKDPNYEEVCTGKSRHAEVCQIFFDSTVVTFERLLELFWKIHDPTTPNRQGNDIGSQYRSVIFYDGEEQEELAKKSRQKLEKSGLYNRPIVTQIEPLDMFYPAETYHQNYYRDHSSESYCQYVIHPKLEKLNDILS